MPLPFRPFSALMRLLPSTFVSTISVASSFRDRPPPRRNAWLVAPFRSATRATQPTRATACDTSRARAAGTPRTASARAPCAGRRLEAGVHEELVRQRLHRAEAVAERGRERGRLRVRRAHRGEGAAAARAEREGVARQAGGGRGVRRGGALEGGEGRQLEQPRGRVAVRPERELVPERPRAPLVDGREARAGLLRLAQQQRPRRRARAQGRAHAHRRAERHSGALLLAVLDEREGAAQLLEREHFPARLGARGPRRGPLCDPVGEDQSRYDAAPRARHGRSRLWARVSLPCSPPRWKAPVQRRVNGDKMIFQLCVFQQASRP